MAIKLVRFYNFVNFDVIVWYVMIIIIYFANSNMTEKFGIPSVKLQNHTNYEGESLYICHAATVKPIWLKFCTEVDYTLELCIGYTFYP